MAVGRERDCHASRLARRVGHRRRHWDTGSMGGSDFERSLDERDAAAAAFVNGTASPLVSLTGRPDEAALFDPSGGIAVGGRDRPTARRRERRALPVGHYEFERLLSRSDGDLAFVCGVQKTVARLRGSSSEGALHLRVTEIYRRIEGQWRLLHRHADRLPAYSPVSTAWMGSRERSNAADHRGCHSVIGTRPVIAAG